jgi:CRP-like cAMP-binding protein
MSTREPAAVGLTPAGSVAAADLTIRVGGRRAAQRDLVPILAGIPLFAGLSKRDLRRVAAVSVLRTVPRGSRIVREGEPGRAFYVLLNGTARVVIGGAAVATLAPGQFFGELSLVDGGPRTATITAEEETAVLELSRAAFTGLLTDQPSIALALLRTLAGRIRALS